MSTTGQIRWKNIKKMLDDCLPQWTLKENKHKYIILANDLNNSIYPHLPLGKHGKRDNPAIERGHVKNMVNFFDIFDCAKKKLKGL